MENVWINAFIKPKETFAAEKPNASIGKAIMYFLIAMVISAIISIVISGVMSVFSPEFAFNIFGLLFVWVFLIPIFLVMTLVGILITWIIAKLLGGTGSYTSLLYLVSLYAVPVAILGIIPIGGWLVALYAIYLFFLAIKESMGLSTGKAILTIVIPIAIGIILVIILVVLLGMTILTALSQMNPTGNFGLM